MRKLNVIKLPVLVSILALSLLIGVSPLLRKVRADASTDDWPMFGHDLNHTGFTTSTAPNTNRTLWISEVGPIPYLFQGGSPSVAEGKVYHFAANLPSRMGHEWGLRCFDAATGETIWIAYTGSVALDPAPAVVDGYVYFCAGTEVYCFDAATGTQIWNFTTLKAIYTSPAVAYGRVCVAESWAGLDHIAYVYCLNATTGTQLWNYSSSQGFTSWPAVVDGRVYIGCDDANLYCLDAYFGTKIWNYTTGNEIDSSPSVADGKVYVGSQDYNVYCFDAATGTLIWNYTTQSGISSSPAVVSDRVFIGSHDANIYCLNASTGTRLWNYATQDEVVSSPAVADGKVYIGSDDDKLYCLDAITGTKLWSYTTGRDVDSTPAIVDGVLFFSSSNGYLYAISDEGAGDWPTFQYDATRAGYTSTTGPARNFTLWTFTTGSVVESSPAVVAGRLYVSALDGTVYCLNASTGVHVWNFTKGGTMNSPTVAGDRVYVGGGEQYDTVFCLDASTGTLRWSYETPWELATAPAVRYGRVYLGCMDDWFYCLDASNGTLRWRYLTGGNCHVSSPAVAEGRVYVGCDDYKLYCFDTLNGTLLWNFTTGSYVLSSPAVVDGNVYVGSADAKVYCVDAAIGTHLWNASTGAAVLSSPAVAHGRVYVGSMDYRLYCLNASTGAHLWNVTTEGAVNSSPAVAATRVYVGSDDTRVYCLDAFTGALLWTYQTMDSVLSSPAITDGHVYIGSRDAAVYAFGSRLYIFPVTIESVTHNVTVETNSLLSAFTFNRSAKTLRFNATGTPGTQAFVNITIPSVLLGGPYVVLEDSMLRTPIETTNATHNTLYLEYVNDRHTLEVIGTTVIPEFPVVLSTLLLLTITSLALLYAKRTRAITAAHTT